MTYFKSLIEIKSLYTRQCPLGSRFSGSVFIEVIPELGNFITLFTQSYVPVPSLSCQIYPPLMEYFCTISHTCTGLKI